MAGEPIHQAAAAAAYQAFEAWRRAVAALRAAEQDAVPHVELVRLSEEVIRTRNVLVLDRLSAGLPVADDIARHLEADEVLLHQHDDTHTDGLR
jgi:hypothetical protein